MKINKNIYVAMMTIALCGTALVSCSDDNEGGNLYPAVIPSSVEFSLPEAQQALVYTDATGSTCLPMVKGESLQLNYTMAPENVTFSDVQWTSSNTNYATVSDQGLVNAVNGDGYSIVQVAPIGLHEGSGINANIKVVVSAEMHKATAISIFSTAEEVYAGDTLHFTAYITPDNATYKTVKWSVSDESAASIDPVTGILTAKQASAVTTKVNVVATALDGSGVVEQKEISVKKIVTPESVTIDQTYSAANGYECAFNEKSLNLGFTTVPAECTTSLLKWTSSDESIATVDAGVVTFKGFGKVTITAATPDGKSSSIELNIPCGLVRETYHNQNFYNFYNAQQSGNGTSSSHVWHDGYITITTYTQNATKQRGDLKWWGSPATFHAGNYPVVAIKMDEVKEIESGITARNITFDLVGKSESGADYKNLGGNNNKYSSDYTCSDGSHVFVYDMSTVAFQTGGLAPTNESITFSTFNLKVADIATVTHQIHYNVYWLQTFKSIADMEKYLKDVDKVSFEVK